MKQRIWELDAFRGICILGMVIVHFIFDLTDFYGILQWEYPLWFSLILNWGGVLFLVLSGICVTLGSRSVRRGLIVLGCGMLFSAVTAGMYALSLADRSIIIYFGVLHCLGTCMLLWPLVRNCPTWLLAVLGALLTVLGLLMSLFVLPFPWLMPLGFVFPGFESADYFPLLPNFGYFLLGAVLGRTLYRRKQTLFPKVNAANPILRTLQFCGRHSLFIYLLHQPVLAGICYLLTL